MSIVEEKYEALLEASSVYIKKEENINIIKRAYQYAKEKHAKQIRKSGEPYIIHPIEVSLILTSFHAGPKTIAAGLMHDVLEDTEVTEEEMADLFGNEITTLVDGVTKLGQIKYVSKEQAQAKNHQKMFLAMAKDIRVIIIKLADRLHNMRTLKHMPRHKQVRISKETLGIFAPIAHRLGMYRLKSELEDRCLRFIDPEEYYYIASLINTKQREREDDIDSIINEIKGCLKEQDIKFAIKGRIKNIFSVHKKMREKNKEFSEIFDLLALRIIVDDEASCYQVLGLIHSNWKPIPKRFKDYIAMPKPNMYQSLHTTIIALNGKIFEVQIRTNEMDLVAEYGVAAHWAYKESEAHTAEQEQVEIQKKLKWYREMVEYSENSDAEDFMELIKDDIISANVYVFTPEGDVLDFPNGATPIDFAYRIHSEVGNKTVGAIVNGKIVPLTYQMKTGDVIEIKTSKQSFGPSEDWMKIVKTAHARNKIKQYYNKQNRSIIVDRGRDALLKELDGNEHINEKLNDEHISEHFSKQGINSLEELYYAIGKKAVSPQTVHQKMFKDQVEFDEKQLLEAFNEKTIENRRKKVSDTGIYVTGLENPQIKISRCCTPIPGDEIIGYVTKGKGITVHRKDCRNVVDSQKERMIDVFWAETTENKEYELDMKITSFNRKNLLTDIIHTITAMNISILTISADAKNDHLVVIKLKVNVRNAHVLQTLVVNLKKVSDVYSVERLNK
ncbi:RelA/SpoT family protein [Haloplasma contractile]|uniref:Penta-phosphate guanosine-3'-pyrophosphohydrolase n=1 Tax=Haloplasma contractile SSD-17B TaxID=1033810 RepID=F7PVT4_9MOLU|nr:bifunctional (p)ppGpp synthetase/guanosine-3',5'-bis(diphosphate) 3'-pyrophosphohydrolase [Haloplasma contractile]ERJ12744.1 RelA protein [Haloplasma contractile SSD-17B]